MVSLFLCLLLFLFCLLGLVPICYICLRSLCRKAWLCCRIRIQRDDNTTASYQSPKSLANLPTLPCNRIAQLLSLGNLDYNVYSTNVFSHETSWFASARTLQRNHTVKTTSILASDNQPVCDGSTTASFGAATRKHGTSNCRVQGSTAV